VAKILVADDNSNIQKMVGLALKDQGIDVVAVGNGEAAVRKISDIRPDLVLADVFMPVRNGYEVCKYVKEDSSLAHIPVILLVGAFDPLDEQEAQRVGADGVLKKPFVPPDPLISMVKSALARAGVSIGPNAGAEKIAPPPAPKRSTADILSGGVSPKLPVFTPENLPEIAPEPLEEFATGTPHLKIAAGNEPLAFGSLLDTNEAEDLAITAKPMIEIAKERKWDEESDEVEEEKEETEESTSGGWRPGLDETLSQVPEPVEAAPDWRDEAFHGSAPASSFPAPQWTSTETQPSFAEAAESHAVAVATVEHKPVEEAAPFAGDAWAAAMAAGVEDKVGEVQGVATEPVPEVASLAQEQVIEPSDESAAQVQESAPVGAQAPVVEIPSHEPTAEPANWAPAPETAWESEAKKASLLASTWDAPKPFSVEETQEIPAYAAEPQVEHVETSVEQDVEQSAYSAEPAIQHESESEEKIETPTAEAEQSVTTETTEAPSSHSDWEAPVTEPAPIFEEVATVEEAPKEQVAQTQAPEPDMDELVARVLGRMNPEVLQKVTREILKPVIEAIVRDEFNSKK
jgi:CheY-like chemotaxis protein